MLVYEQKKKKPDREEENENSFSRIMIGFFERVTYRLLNNSQSKTLSSRNSNRNRSKSKLDVEGKHNECAERVSVINANLYEDVKTN